MILTLLVLLAAHDGCDAARRDAIRAAEIAWMQDPEQLPARLIVGSPCSCGDCTTTLEIRPLGSYREPGTAYYECKLHEAKEREAAQRRAEQARLDAEARVDAAKEAMYRVRDACGEGPKRPKPIEPLSSEASRALVIGGRP